jgi:hypothetical protein
MSRFETTSHFSLQSFRRALGCPLVVLTAAAVVIIAVAIAYLIHAPAGPGF